MLIVFLDDEWTGYIDLFLVSVKLTYATGFVPANIEIRLTHSISFQMSEEMYTPSTVECICGMFRILHF